MYQLSLQHKLCSFKTIPVNIQFITEAKYIIINNTPPPSLYHPLPPPPLQAPTSAVIIARETYYKVKVSLKGVT